MRSSSRTKVYLSLKAPILSSALNTTHSPLAISRSSPHPNMSPLNPCVISQLRQLIYYHLDHYLLRNALFFAGRLQAYDPKSPESAYLLALCHFRLGSLKSAYDSSRHWGQRATHPHLGCSYIFAQACLGLGKFIEGTAALDKSKGSWRHMNSWSEWLSN